MAAKGSGSGAAGVAAGAAGVVVERVSPASEAMLLPEVAGAAAGGACNPGDGEERDGS